MEELTVERIGGIYVWNKHERRVSCKGLDMIEDALHKAERRSDVVWYHEEESRQGPIDCTILKLEDDRSDGVHDLPDTLGRIIARIRCGCGVSDRNNSGYTV